MSAGDAPTEDPIARARRLAAEMAERRKLEPVLNPVEAAQRLAASMVESQPPIRANTETALSAQPAGQQQLAPNPPVFDPNSERAIEAQPDTPHAVTEIEGELSGPVKAVADFARTPEVQRVLVESGADIAGSLVGGQLAAARGLGTLGTVGLRALGAGVGAGAGSLAMEPFDPSDDPYERALLTAGLATVAEGGVGGFFDGMKILVGKGSLRGGRFRPAKLTGKPFDSSPQATVDEFYDAVTKHVDPKTGRVLQPTPGTGSDAYWIDFTENIMANAPMSAGRIRDTKEAVELALASDVDQLVKGMSKVHGRKAVSLLARAARENNTDLWKARGAVLFDGVDEAAGGIRIDLAPAVETAEEIVERNARGVASPAEIKFADSVLQHVKVDDAGNVIDTTVDFRTAQDLRSDFIAANLGLEAPVKGRGEAAVARLAGKMDESIEGSLKLEAAVTEELGKSLDEIMEAAGESLSGEAYKRWRRANWFWKAGSKRYNNEIVNNIANGYPQAFMRSAVPGQKWDDIRLSRKAVGEEAWKGVQGEYMSHALTQVSRSDLDLAKGIEVLDYIRKDLGEEGWKELIPNGGKRTNIEKALTFLHHSQKQSGKGVGGTFMSQMVAAGAILTVVGLPVALATGDPIKGLGAAGGVLITPYMLVRLGSKPGFNKWLQVGKVAPRGSARAGVAARALTAMILKEKQSYDERMRKEKLQQSADDLAADNEIGKRITTRPNDPNLRTNMQRQDSARAREREIAEKRQRVVTGANRFVEDNTAISRTSMP